jgi:hypothetical protein
MAPEKCSKCGTIENILHYLVSNQVLCYECVKAVAKDN